MNNSLVLLGFDFLCLFKKVMHVVGLSIGHVFMTSFAENGSFSILLFTALTIVR